MTDRNSEGAGKPGVSGLSGVSETLLIPLTARVVGSRDPTLAFEDPEAERIATSLGYDLGPWEKEWTQVEAVLGRTAILDDICATFLVANPGGQVINLGAGLCTRFERVGGAAGRWLDVDLPQVATIADQLLTPDARRTRVGLSVLSPEWHDHARSGIPTLVIAEGLLMYLEPADVRALLAELATRYPGGELALEGISRFLLRGKYGQGSDNIQRSGAQFRWGLNQPEELVAMVPGSLILGVRFHAEVYPKRWRWLRITQAIERARQAMKVVHLRFPASP